MPTQRSATSAPNLRALHHSLLPSYSGLSSYQCQAPGGYFIQVVSLTLPEKGISSSHVRVEELTP